MCCSLHERWQTEFRVSSLKTLEARVRELASSSVVKLHPKHTAVPLCGERLERCLRCRVTAAAAEVTGSRTRGVWSGRKMSYILWQAASWVQFSITAVVRVLCAHVCTASVCVCVRVSISRRRVSQQDLGTGVPAHQDLTKGTDGALWGVLTVWSPPSTTPPPPPPHTQSLPPSVHHHSQLCTASAISSKQLVILSW